MKSTINLALIQFESILGDLAANRKKAETMIREAVAAAENTSIEITDVVRFETGEGIEKAEEDFAAEVAAQLK